MKETDWAYLAGFIDADGCISFPKGKSGNRRPRVRIPQTDQESLRELQAKFDVGILRLKPPSQTGFSKKMQLEWTIGSAEGVRWILGHTLPYLILKRDKAREALDALAG